MFVTEAMAPIIEGLALWVIAWVLVLGVVGFFIGVFHKEYKDPDQFEL